MPALEIGLFDWLAIYSAVVATGTVAGWAIQRFQNPLRCEWRLPEPRHRPGDSIACGVVVHNRSSRDSTIEGFDIYGPKGTGQKLAMLGVVDMTGLVDNVTGHPVKLPLIIHPWQRSEIRATYVAKAPCTLDGLRLMIHSDTPIRIYRSKRFDLLINTIHP